MQIIQGPQGDLMIEETPGQGWKPITEQEAAIQMQSRGERFMGAVGDTLQDAGGAALEMMTPLTGRELSRDDQGAVTGTAPVLGQRIMQANDARQAERGRIDPFASNTGAAVGFGAEVAAGGVPSMARKAITPLSRGAAQGTNAATAAIEAVPSTAKGPIASRVPTLGQVGTLIGDTAESIPLLGPSVKGGRRAATAGRARLAEDKRIRQAVGAQAADVPRYNQGLLSAEALADDMPGVQVPEALASMLDATSNEADVAMKGILRDQALRERTDVGIAEQIIAGERESITGFMADAQDATNRRVMREAGMDPDVMPSVEVFGDNLERISRDFNEIDNRITGPIEVEDMPDMIEELNDRLDLTVEAERALDKISQSVERKIQPDGTMTPEDVSIITNKLTEAIRRASKESTPEKAGVLSEVLEDLRQRVGLRLSPEDVALDRQLRREWGITKSGLNSSASLGPNGVNPKTFLNARGAKNNATKTGRGDELDMFLRTMQAVKDTIPPTSNTAEALSRMDG